MKKNICIFSFFFLIPLIYADTKILNLHGFSVYPYKEIQVKDHGWLESQYLSNTGFSDCCVFLFDDLKEITQIKYYPAADNKNNANEGKIAINNQEFFFKGLDDIQTENVKLYSIEFENKKYLLFIGKMSIGYFYKCYIFDVTNSERIIFYPPQIKLVDLSFGDIFFGVYQNKLCFFFSTQRTEMNGHYRLNPYYIKENILKELCDEKNQPYYLDYSYNAKDMSNLVIEESNMIKKLHK